MTDLNALLERRPDWYSKANCRDVGPSLFFPDKGRVANAARDVCAGCTVRVVCLETALANDEQWGIFGGLNRNQRRQILRARRMGYEDPVFPYRPEPCGSDTAYKRHIREKTPACQPCKDAHAAANLEWKRGAA